MEINYETLTDGELGAMYQNCAYELGKRKTQKQVKAWEKAVEAMRDYVRDYGTIKINNNAFEFHDNSESNDEFEEIFYSNGPGEIFY